MPPRNDPNIRILNRVAERTGTPAPPAAQPAPRFTPDIVCLGDVEPKAIPWLWPDRIASGRITLLSGRPGAGKTFLTADMSARVSKGEDWPDGRGQAPKGSVLLLNAEDDPADTLVPRLIGAGANRNMIHLLRARKLIEATGNESSIALDLSNLDIIEEALSGIPDCRLLVIDPIGSYLGGRTDAHRDNEVRAVLTPLAALASKWNVAALIVCHTRKSAADFADDTVLGSRAFTGIARCVWHLSADSNDRTRKLFLPGKCNIAVSATGLAFRIGPGNEGRPACQWEPDPIEAHADDVVKDVSDGKPGPAPAKRDAVAEWLAELLANGPMFSTDVEHAAEDAGYARSTLRRAMKVLNIKPVKNSSGRWTWSLPPQGAQARQDRPRCSSSMEPEHLRENPGENSQKALENAQGAQVPSNLSTLAEHQKAALPPWEIHERFMELMEAVGWKLEDLLKFLNAKPTDGVYDLTRADRKRAYEHLCTLRARELPN